MKSIVPASAQWRSSKDRTTVPVAARRSKNVRQAPKSWSEPIRRSRFRGARAGRARPSAARRFGTISRSSRTEPILARVVRSSSVSAGPARPRIISLRAQNVTPFAVCRRTASMPLDGAHDPVEVLLELPGEAALADPTDPGDQDEPGPPFPGPSHGRGP